MIRSDNHIKILKHGTKIYLIHIPVYHLKIESYVQYKINLNHKSNRFESRGQTEMHEGSKYCCHFFQKQPPEMFYKKGVLRNLAKFTGEHLCQSLLFNKVAGLRLATLLKKRLWHRCFPVNFVKFSGTPSLQNTSGRLLVSFTFLISIFQVLFQ